MRVHCAHVLRGIAADSPSGAGGPPGSARTPLHAPRRPGRAGARVRLFVAMPVRRELPRRRRSGTPAPGGKDGRRRRRLRRRRLASAFRRWGRTGGALSGGAGGGRVGSFGDRAGLARARLAARPLQSASPRPWVRCPWNVAAHCVRQPWHTAPSQGSILHGGVASLRPGPVPVGQPSQSRDGDCPVGCGFVGARGKLNWKNTSADILLESFLRWT